jgi:hypothetical protein
MSASHLWRSELLGDAATVQLQQGEVECFTRG